MTLPLVEPRFDEHRVLHHAPLESEQASCRVFVGLATNGYWASINRGMSKDYIIRQKIASATVREVVHPAASVHLRAQHLVDPIQEDFSRYCMNPLVDVVFPVAVEIAVDTLLADSFFRLR